MDSKESVVKCLQEADAVCFDVDSTVCTGEGIDDIAEWLGCGKKIKDLTLEAMGGSLNFTEALRLRLGIMNPHHTQITDFLSHHPITLTPGIQSLITVLQSLNKTPYLVSGGFQELIHPVAEVLGIPRENVYANKLKFYFDGTFAGFDESQLTSKTGGKGDVIELLRKKHSVIVMIGDGVTDLETSADGFIGFGGNVIREVVKSNSKWFVTDFKEITNVLI